MTEARRLWLVRHGETEGQSSIRYHGRNDVPLSHAGRQQIRALLPLLRGVPFCAVVHSPLSRAAESAAILAEGLSLDAALLRVDERLREISFGACEGMTREEIDAAHPTFWRDNEQGLLDAFPGGEPRGRFAARVAAAANELVGEPWRGDLLLVAHRGIVKHTIAALLSLGAAELDALGVELASVSVLREHDGAWRLDVLGMRP